MSLIILEGPDCAGKTTFAGRLIDALRGADPDASVGYRHAGVPVDHPLDEYARPLEGYRVGDDHLVCDRWHVGEHVYPRVTGRRTDLTDGIRTWLELFLRSRGALLVHCDASDDRLAACGVARGDLSTELARLPHATRLFREYVARETLLPTLSVDVSDPDDPGYADVVAEVLGYAAQETRAAASLAPFVTYVGPPRPSLLLVGDRRGTPSHDLAEFGLQPAFVPATGTSGHYLMTTLTSQPLRVPTHGVQLRDIGLVNACDVDDVRACWEAVGQPAVVGLGRNAQGRLREVGVPHRDAPHPQHRRRFHHREHASYLAALLGDHVAAVTA